MDRKKETGGWREWKGNSGRLGEGGTRGERGGGEGRRGRKRGREERGDYIRGGLSKGFYPEWVCLHTKLDSCLPSNFRLYLRLAKLWKSVWKIVIILIIILVYNVQ